MSGEKTVAEKVHAELGASSAARWMACPGSVQLVRLAPKQLTSEFAIEGTRAHAVAELALSKGVDPDFFIGMDVEGAKVPEEMAEHVAVFVNYCRRINEECDEHWIERRFTLASLNPPVPMFGTADHVAYSKTERRLYVSDLKYGQGVIVEVKENEQLMYYALGAALSFDPAQYPIDEITMTIVQPRGSHPDGVIRPHTISFIDLLDFAADLLDAAKATQQPNAPLAAGEHCRFCPAAAMCPEQMRHAQELAQIEWANPVSIPPAPETMPIEMIIEMLPKFDILEAWMKACRATIFAKLEAGEDVPGYKLVMKRAQRKWGDPDGVAQLLKAKSYAPEEIFDMSIRSPAQIEKLMGKKLFADSLATSVIKQSSGYKMVPASDPSPAVSVTRGEEFFALPSGDE